VTIHRVLAVPAAWLLLCGLSEKGADQRRGTGVCLNHEIRNALELIGQAGYLLNNVVYGSAVSEGIEKI
jgi:hypothetical protein